MAIIQSLKLDNSRSTSRQGQTAADYNMNGDFFTIWSYKNGDVNRDGDCPQVMQFDKNVAKVLRDALNVFLGDA
ncbi:MAG: hypothetical protein FWC27_09260 [Firmicutes bacterium]|nr:hypothetical protein [Bacillota bacterium]